MKYQARIFGVLLALLLATVSGCSSARSQATSTHAKTVHCGALDMSDSGIWFGRPNNSTPSASIEPGSPKDPIGCFTAAAKHCTPATLEYHHHEIDTGTIETLSITASRHGSCTIADTTQAYSANFGGSSATVASVLCTSVTRQGTGITLGGCTNELRFPGPPSAGDSAGRRPLGGASCVARSNGEQICAEE